jgi:hypothetical protein
MGLPPSGLTMGNSALRIKSVFFAVSSKPFLPSWSIAETDVAVTTRRLGSLREHNFRSCDGLTDVTLRVVGDVN